ncbi:competence protein ComEC, partial [Pseudomonas syringae]
RAEVARGVDARAPGSRPPAHGSRASASQAFLRAVAPVGVLMSRGRSNAFGHPHPLVMARYRGLGIASYDSAELGAVRLQLGTFGTPQAERAQRRFWRD